MLVIFDELNRVLLGRARDGDRPGVGEKAVQRVIAFAQYSFHVIDGVNEARVHFDLSSAYHLDAAGLADAGLVVAVDVGAHGELGVFFLRRQKLQYLGGVADGVAAALDGA